MAIEDLELESRPPLTVEEFEALAETEGWNEDTRVELLDGEVVWMNPINDPHAACVRRLTQLFSRHYAANLALVSVQNPIRIERSPSLCASSFVRRSPRCGLVSRYSRPRIRRLATHLTLEDAIRLTTLKS